MHQLDHSFEEYQQNKREYYALMHKQLGALIAGEANAIANLSQFAAFIYHMLPDLNWTGFYLKSKENDLVLGPFQGQVACVRIPIGRGVCGTAASTRKVQLVDDVHQFDGHIACDAASNSEIVLPMLKNDQMLGVLDIDSPKFNRFDAQDKEGLQSLLDLLLEHSEF